MAELLRPPGWVQTCCFYLDSPTGSSEWSSGSACWLHFDRSFPLSAPECHIQKTFFIQGWAVQRPLWSKRHERVWHSPTLPQKHKSWVFTLHCLILYLDVSGQRAQGFSKHMCLCEENSNIGIFLFRNMKAKKKSVSHYFTERGKKNKEWVQIKFSVRESTTKRELDVSLWGENQTQSSVCED